MKFCPTCFVPIHDPQHPKRKFCSMACNTSRRQTTAAEEEVIILREAANVTHRDIALELGRSLKVVDKIVLRLQHEGRIPRRKPGRKPGKVTKLAAPKDKGGTKKCNRCRRWFKPEHRFIFQCETCKERESWRSGVSSWFAA